MNDDLADLRVEQLREALSLLGLGEPSDLPPGRAGAGRALREALVEPGFVRSKLNDAPAKAVEAFARLAREGPLSVEALLGRGWWGRGTLPTPLDWLQRRALIRVDQAGLVRATASARQGWSQQHLDVVAAAVENRSAGEDESATESGSRSRSATKSEEPQQPHLRLVTAQERSSGAGDAAEGQRPVVVEAAGSVVICDHPAELDRVLGVLAAGLREVAPTIAVSKLGKAALENALRAGGIRLLADEEVSAQPASPALPGSPERAVTPWDIRSVFTRAIEEQRQLHLLYYPSSRGGAATERTVDPWSFTDDLLVGWCHLRGGERTFALDRVGGATLLASTIEHARS